MAKYFLYDNVTGSKSADDIFESLSQECFVSDSTVDANWTYEICLGNIIYQVDYPLFMLYTSYVCYVYTICFIACCRPNDRRENYAYSWKVLR